MTQLLNTAPVISIDHNTHMWLHTQCHNTIWLRKYSKVNYIPHRPIIPETTLFETEHILLEYVQISYATLYKITCYIRCEKYTLITKMQYKYNL